MKGTAHCTFHTTPVISRQFENINLTCVGEEGIVILSRGPEEQPEEVLCIEAVQLDILSDFSIDLAGFICLDEDQKTFHKCSLVFAPVLIEKEAA